MGFLDWFKSEPSRLAVREQWIWLSKQAKLAGIAAEVEQGLAGGVEAGEVLLVAHFQDCLDELRSLVDERQFDTRSVFVVAADGLEGQSAGGVTFDESHSVRVIVAERHPLSSFDEAVLEFARDLPCRCSVIHHISLDDPLMRIFSAKGIRWILERLGMKEDEALTSRMITRRLEQTQRRIEGQSTGDLPAESAEQWFEYNCRYYWPKISG